MTGVNEALIFFSVFVVFVWLFSTVFYLQRRSLFQKQCDEYESCIRTKNEIIDCRTEAIMSLQRTIDDLQKEKLELQSKPKEKAPSFELTEFLTDVNQHGYGFVRVDPATIIKRSPRDF